MVFWIEMDFLSLSLSSLHFIFFFFFSRFALHKLARACVRISRGIYTSNPFSESNIRRISFIAGLIKLVYRHARPLPRLFVATLARLSSENCP